MLTTNRKSWRRVSALLMAVAFAAACGGGDEGSDEGGDAAVPGTEDLQQAGGGAPPAGVPPVLPGTGSDTGSDTGDDQTEETPTTTPPPATPVTFAMADGDSTESIVVTVPGLMAAGVKIESYWIERPEGHAQFLSPWSSFYIRITDAAGKVLVPTSPYQVQLLNFPKFTTDYQLQIQSAGAGKPTPINARRKSKRKQRDEEESNTVSPTFDLMQGEVTVTISSSGYEPFDVPPGGDDGSTDGDDSGMPPAGGPTAPPGNRGMCMAPPPEPDALQIKNQSECRWDRLDERCPQDGLAEELENEKTYAVFLTYNEEGIRDFIDRHATPEIFDNVDPTDPESICTDYVPKLGKVTDARITYPEGRHVKYPLNEFGTVILPLPDTHVLRCDFFCQACTGPVTRLEDLEPKYVGNATEELDFCPVDSVTIELPSHVVNLTHSAGGVGFKGKNVNENGSETVEPFNDLTDVSAIFGPTINATFDQNRQGCEFNVEGPRYTWTGYDYQCSLVRNPATGVRTAICTERKVIRTWGHLSLRVTHSPRGLYVGTTMLVQRMEVDPAEAGTLPDDPPEDLDYIFGGGGMWPWSTTTDEYDLYPKNNTQWTIRLGGLPPYAMPAESEAVATFHSNLD